MWFIAIAEPGIIFEDIQLVQSGERSEYESSDQDIARGCCVPVFRPYVCESGFEEGGRSAGETPVDYEGLLLVLGTDDKSDHGQCYFTAVRCVSRRAEYNIVRFMLS